MTEKTSRQLVAELAELDAEIERRKKLERNAVLVEIRTLMESNDLGIRDLMPPRASRPPRFQRAPYSLGTAVPKYRDPASGATWSGRGKPPQWIRDKDREQFLIDSAGAVQ